MCLMMTLRDSGYFECNESIVDCIFIYSSLGKVNYSNTIAEVDSLGLNSIDYVESQKREQEKTLRTSFPTRSSVAATYFLGQ